jgi:hypothetical protein
MLHELIDDRFLPDGSGRWIDLATGRTAIVPAWSDERPGGRPRSSQRKVSDVMALAETATAGIHYMHVTSAASAATPLLSCLAGQLRQLGFVTLRAAIRLPPTLRAHLCHRHLAVHFRCRDERGPIVEWIRSLARTSPRAHLLIEIDDSEAADAGRPSKDAGPIGLADFSGWTSHVSTATRRIQALLDEARFEEADALLASLDVEAAVRRVRSPDCVSLAWSRLRTCQGRTEEARRRLNAVRVTSHPRELNDASAARHSHLAATGSRR